MITKVAQSLKEKKVVTLYSETSLSDYLAGSLLDLYEDTQEPAILSFLEKPQTEEYYLTLRICYTESKPY